MPLEYAKRKGFTLIEVLVTVSIIMIALGGVIWSLNGQKSMAKLHLAVHRASMITTAKQAYAREEGIAAIKAYQKTKTDEERFNLIKNYLPYAGTQTTLKGYTPEGYHYEMAELHDKVAIFEGKEKTPIYY